METRARRERRKNAEERVVRSSAGGLAVLSCCAIALLACEEPKRTDNPPASQNELMANRWRIPPLLLAPGAPAVDLSRFLLVQSPDAGTDLRWCSDDASVVRLDGALAMAVTSGPSTYVRAWSPEGHHVASIRVETWKTADHVKVLEFDQVLSPTVTLRDGPYGGAGAGPTGRLLLGKELRVRVRPDVDPAVGDVLFTRDRREVPPFRVQTVTRTGSVVAVEGPLVFDDAEWRADAKLQGGSEAVGAREETRPCRPR